MEGYADAENKRKANRVRQLIRISIDKRNDEEDGDEELREARKISKELAEYLKTNYPTSFNIHYRLLYGKEWESLFQYLNGNGENKVFKRLVDFHQIKVHDILVVQNLENNSLSKRSLAIFFDDQGPHFTIGYGDELQGPKEWYEFTERMGLLPHEAGYLYDEDIVFYNREGQWPLVEKYMIRL